MKPLYQHGMLHNSYTPHAAQVYSQLQTTRDLLNTYNNCIQGLLYHYYTQLGIHNKFEKTFIMTIFHRI